MDPSLHTRWKPVFMDISIRVNVKLKLQKGGIDAGGLLATWQRRGLWSQLGDNNDASHGLGPGYRTGQGLI